MEPQNDDWWTIYKNKTAECPVQTHTEFSQTQTNILYVPQNKRESFMKHYTEAVMYNIANGNKKKICFSEKIDKNAGFVYKFFVDVDFDLKSLLAALFPYIGDEANLFFEEIIDQIKKVVCRILEDGGYGDLTSVQTAKRCCYKIHLIYPDVIVSSKTAIDLTKKIIAQLNLNPNQYFDWKKVIDVQCHNTGLRMVGSSKGTFGKSINTEKQNVFDHYQIFSNKYKLDNIYTINDTLTPELIELCSIHTTREENVVTKRSKTTASSQVDSSKFDLAIDGHIKNNTRILREVKEACEQFNEEEGFAIKSELYKYESNESHGRFVVLVPQECPFVGRLHNRTKEKRSPCLYLSFGTKRTSLRCFACESDERVIYKGNDSITKLELLSNALMSRTNVAVGELCYHLLKDSKAACRKADSSLSFNWYKYNKDTHGWRRYDSISLDISRPNYIVDRELSIFRALLLKETEVEVDKQYINELYGKLTKDLGSITFVENVKKYLGQLLHEHYLDADGNTFEARLDKKPNLLGCRNGVLECINGQFIFRDGKPEDMLLRTTKQPYKEWTDSMSEEEKNLVLGMLKKTMDNDIHRKYIVWSLARGANGLTRRAKLNNWWGAGSDGKSQLIQWLKSATGDYFGSGANTMITGKVSTDSSSAREDVATIEGKRWYFFNELNPNSTVNLEFIKLLTGSDDVPFRKLYSAQTDMVPQASFWTTSNDIPKYVFKYSDNGAKRRIAISKFETRFYETEKELRENVDKVKVAYVGTSEEELLKIRPTLARGLLSYLIHIYNTTPHVEVPEDFQKMNQSVIDANDHVLHFMKSSMILSQDTNDWVHEEILYTRFRQYMSSIGERFVINLDKFRKYLSEKIGDPIVDVNDPDKKGWLTQLKVRQLDVI